MSETNDPKGNYLSEWFGFRVWPPEAVDSSEEARYNQARRLCPFISAATEQETACIKAKNKGAEPTGVCTISSDSNRVDKDRKIREDWLACPFRLLDQEFTLFREAIRIVFGLGESESISLFPITALNKRETQAEIIQLLRSEARRVYLFTANMLGGEVNLRETESSPGGKVDFSVVEVTGKREPTRVAPLPLEFGRVMIVEIQTADFHGSPTHAVGFLKEVCPKGQTSEYHDQIRNNPNRVGHKVEGPNKSNIFKRTIYQMLYKMELARDPNCAGRKSSFS